MAKALSMLAFASVAQVASLVQAQTSPGPIPVNGTPEKASDPIPESFVSYSLEFVFFPDFAGNISSPNTFSDNLLQNIGDLAGSRPYIRVGGNTQDYALYNKSLQTATNGTYDVSRSPDYPTTIFIGPSFFESYQTWPDTKFSHGFNFGLGGNNTAGWETLLETVPLACKALTGEKLLMWEYGNEPDLFSTSAQGPVRPSSWNESEFVAQWLNGTRAIKAQLDEACPEQALDVTYGYMSPSFAGTGNHLDAAKAFNNKLDIDGDIKLISIHNYIGGATQPGVTLQGTLMNHTSTVHSVSSHLDLRDKLNYTKTPYIIGETNSLYNQGAPGLSNAFGAAIWGVDFNLWCASQDIKRVHMHQGTDYRYAAWQPVSTTNTTLGTKPPYYGSIAVAAILGDLVQHDVQVANLPLEDEFESAYAAYEDGSLQRIAVLNLREYNYTVNGTSSVPNPLPRPSQKYTFQIPAGVEEVDVKRLVANGSDAITGITWNGWSYNWELDEGRPVRLDNVTTGETAVVKDGSVSVAVPDSSVVVLELPRS